MKSQAPLAPAEVAQSVESFVSVNRPVKSAPLCDEPHFLGKCTLVVKHSAEGIGLWPTLPKGASVARLNRLYSDDAQKEIPTSHGARLCSSIARTLQNSCTSLAVCEIFLIQSEASGTPPTTPPNTPPPGRRAVWSSAHLLPPPPG